MGVERQTYKHTHFSENNFSMPGLKFRSISATLKMYLVISNAMHISFTPLIFTSTGEMGNAATQFYKPFECQTWSFLQCSYGCKLSF